ncbi:MAG: hypothetical protein QG614_348 [Patescibacteria group bacterium]|nr:hypothetical protein [Patescibacteria group bacterium]
MSAPESSDKKGGGSNAIGVAIAAAFITLILLNNSTPDNTKFALVVALIAYAAVSGKEKKDHK